ncbi:MAG: ABC transporter ATP-binding protein/permease [Lactobacillales bacterium]|nr:ABC transporter ATP-binding protein/permease [Lactobacillales bacterium]
MISYYKPYKGLFFLDLFSAMAIAIIAVIIPLIIRFLINEVMSWDKAEALRMSAFCLIVILFLAFLLYLFNFITVYYGHLLGTKIEKDVRNELFEHYQKLSLCFYENRKVGELMSRVVVDLENLSEFLHHFPEDMIIITVRFVLVFIIFFLINPILAALAVGIISFCIFYIVVLTPKINKLAGENKEKISEINVQLEDSLAGIKVVKSFTNEEIERQKFKRSNLAFVESRRKYLKQIGVLFAGVNFFVLSLLPIIATMGVNLVIHNLMSISDVITFILYADILIGPVLSILGVYEIMTNAIGGYNRYIEILEVEPDIFDKSNAKVLDSVNGNIVFRNVTFKYEQGHENVFKNLNIEIKPKEYVALVGSSGVGKSTLCNLIPRFYDVNDGEVLIDGTNVKDLVLKSLRKNIGFVLQDAYLFASTIKENIAYGKPEATDEEIIAAAKKAYAHQFIMKFPKGYDTDIGQRGLKLSGGQKQRLSIARVFLKDPKILILDEATSALDNESERFIQDSLEILSQERTTLVIAHRLSTIKKAHRIVVLTDQGIAEEGTHAELLEKNGVYAEIYRMQF